MLAIIVTIMIITGRSICSAINDCDNNVEFYRQC
jgi:hypothetical protein